MYRVISTNILSGQRWVHGDYESVSEAMAATSNYDAGYMTVHYCYDIDNCHEAFFCGIESNTVLAKKRRSALKVLKKIDKNL
jgi:hypothetical protein